MDTVRRGFCGLYDPSHPLCLALRPWVAVLKGAATRFSSVLTWAHVRVPHAHDHRSSVQPVPP